MQGVLKFKCPPPRADVGCSLADGLEKTNYLKRKK
jgi:hypothetical protein